MKHTGLIDLVHTKEDKDKLIEAIDTFAMMLYDTKETINERIDEVWKGEWSSSFRDFLEENAISLDDPEPIQKALHELKITAASLPVIQLEVALEPSPELLSVIINWFSLSVPEKYLLDIIVNKDIIGALRISVNGKFKDYSLKKTVTDMISH